MVLQWKIKTFDELTVHELYKILQLRMQVFVVEQQCAFPDADDNDQKAWHLCAWKEQKLVACARIFAPGAMYREAAIGRVVSAAQVRGTGVGKALMERSVLAVYQLFGRVPIKIGAQLYLKKFYERMGFVQDSDIYLEDNIEHIKMILP
ncbi:GNAT family N-acetyltransferase [Agriterribacter sp.]|uniref:GNAT family N-acetyltransferase n=1 Tax=Agriterribacter sp. TaxID=2821509 RepID=UPI002CD8FB6F|nr:GNAT family N-acetyltransferase [Agriterribacter sp.]HRP57768.1 GNAT family N-acetyltransferase [Agriterribacter sp.]